MKSYFAGVGICCLLFIAGCGDFLTTEMNIVEGKKTRPFSITVDPPDAAPGDEVTVSIQFYEPDRDDFDITWQVALDYDFDLYGDLETERNILQLDEIVSIPEPEVDEGGLAIQTFQFTIPDSTMLVSSGLPETFNDEDIGAELRQMMGAAASEYITKRELNEYCANADVAALEQQLNPEMFEALTWVSEMFACQIRFRARIRSGIELDVTRNCTIRYANRFSDELVNHNPTIRSLAVLAVHGHDVDETEEITDYEYDQYYLYHQDPELIVSDPIQINPDYTYYLYLEHDLETYHSPARIEHVEDFDVSWYYTSLDGMSHEIDLFYDENGEETDTDAEGNFARLLPEEYGSHKEFRIFVVVRDWRPEWRMYHTTAGTDFMTTIMEFE